MWCAKLMESAISPTAHCIAYSWPAFHAGAALPDIPPRWVFTFLECWSSCKEQRTEWLQDGAATWNKHGKRRKRGTERNVWYHVRFSTFTTRWACPSPLFCSASVNYTFFSPFSCCFVSFLLVFWGWRLMSKSGELFRTFDRKPLSRTL